MRCKVLFISDISRAPFTSVADRMLVRGLHDMGVQIDVVTPAPTNETRELEAHGIKMFYLPLVRKIDPAAIKKLRRIMKEGGYDIVHVTYSKAATNGFIASAGLHIKKVAYYGSMSLYWHDPSAYLGFLNPTIDAIICPSDTVAAHVRKQLPARRRMRVTRIYRGYEPSWFDMLEQVTRESLGVSDDEFLICSVGNLRKVKGIRYLISAAGLLPREMKVKVLLVGSETDSEETRGLAKATGRPESFILQGHVAVSPSYVFPCDLYVQPSLSEGLGRAISEAMCLAKPVIVTDGGGAKEFFARGDNGFVVPRASAEALAERITWCYENRNSLRLTGDKARETMLQEFNHRHTVASTHEVYLRLLQHAGVI